MKCIYTYTSPGGKRAGVGQRAVGLALDVTLLLPLGEVTQGSQLGGVLHPLDDLEEKQNLVSEIKESL